jgi:hypothetical protein
VAHALIELLGVDAISIMDEEARRVVERHRFASLLQRPLCRGVSGHIDVQETAAGVFHEHKDVEEPERGCDHDAEITDHKCLGMIADKRQPPLG